MLTFTCPFHLNTSFVYNRINIILLDFSFGERSFENIQYQCEEAECQQLIAFITNLMQDVESKSPSVVGSVQLQCVF